MTHSKLPTVGAQLAFLVTISLIPLTFGFGVYPLLIPTLITALIALLFIGAKPFLENIQNLLTQRGYLTLLLFLSLFLATYWGFYIPYHPEILKMPWAYFQVLFILSLLIVLWVGFFTNPIEHIGFIWSFSLGTLVLNLATVGVAMAIQPPPYYGNIIDIRYLPFGLIRYINTPGLANLLCLFPVTFLAGILLNPTQRPRWFWALGTFGFILSLGSAVALGQRSYFVVTFVIEPMIVSFFLIFLKSWRPFIALCSLLISYPILRWADQVAGTAFLYRPLDQGLLHDARFQMIQFWFNHFLENPFQRSEVGPNALSSFQWFHNFFADIHRLSGFWALLSAAILIIFIFYRIICVIRIDSRFGLFLLAIAIPCFLIINTSVVPEGERQPFLLLLAIGAISEVAISREKRRAKLYLKNTLP